MPETAQPFDHQSRPGGQPVQRDTVGRMTAEALPAEAFSASFDSLDSAIDKPGAWA
jgi:hypothetical protein